MVAGGYPQIIIAGKATDRRIPTWPGFASVVLEVE